MLGKPIRVTRTDTMMIAEKMRQLLHTPELWSGHKRERDVLVMYYLIIHPNEPIGCIARKLECKPWQVETVVKNALYYLSTIWRD